MICFKLYLKQSCVSNSLISNM